MRIDLLKDPKLLETHPIMGQKSVQYQCHCINNNGFNQGQQTEFLSHINKVESLTQPLINYHFCNTCLKICCYRCIKEKILFHYCPICLFEIQGVITQPEKLKCWRNCLSCPVCQSGLTVLETVEEPQSKLGVMAIPPDTSVKDSESIRKFHLRCSCCKYDSREDDIELDKLSFLANTIAQLERDNEISYKEVNNLQLHYDIEHMIPYFFNFNPNLYAIEEVDGFDIKVLDLFKLRGKKYNSVLSQFIKKDENLMEEIKEFNQKKEQDIISGNAPSVEEILNYGLNLNEKKYPQRQNLKSRRSKLCPHCNEIISDPSVKASQEHKFFFKCPAYREVPDIKIENDVIELRKDKMSVLKLKFINPLKFQTFIHLNSPLSNTWFIKGQSNDINDILEIEEQKQDYIEDPLKRFDAVFNHTIKFVSPKFSIDGNATNASEMNLMEEDEEEMIEVDKVTMEQIKELDYNADKPFQAVYERVKNTTCVYLPIIPKGEPGQEVVLPLLMAYTTKVKQMKGNEDDEEEMEVEEEKKIEDFKTVHVWVYLRLGKILN